jgi:molecular chaperone GrpE
MPKELTDQEQDSVTDSPPAQPIPVKIKTAKNDEPLRVTDRRFWVHPHAEEATGDVSSSLKPSYVEELEKKLAESQKKLEEVLATYRVFKAEADAETRQAKERIQNEYNRRVIQAKGTFAERLVEVLENLDRALAASSETESFSILLEGVKLIRSQFSTALFDLGLQEMQVIGEPFNPEVAEAIQIREVDNETADNQVLEVISKGYTLNGTLIRPARVVVGKFKIGVYDTAEP